jgi:hypothetical protein
MAPSSPNTEEPPVNPQTYAEFYRQGWALHAAGKQDAAETNLRKAIELEPESVDAYYTLVGVESTGSPEEVVEAFGKF